MFDQWEQSRGQDSPGPHGARIMNQNTRDTREGTNTAGGFVVVLFASFLSQL